MRTRKRQLPVLLSRWAGRGRKSSRTRAWTTTFARSERRYLIPPFRTRGSSTSRPSTQCLSSSFSLSSLTVFSIAHKQQTRRPRDSEQEADAGTTSSILRLNHLSLSVYSGLDADTMWSKMPVDDCSLPPPAMDKYGICLKQSLQEASQQAHIRA